MTYSTAIIVDSHDHTLLESFLAALGPHPDFSDAGVAENRESPRHPCRKQARLHALHDSQVTSATDCILYEISRDSLGVLVPQETALGGDWVIALPRTGTDSNEPLVLLCSTARICGSGTRYDAIGARVKAVLAGNQAFRAGTAVYEYRWVLLPNNDSSAARLIEPPPESSTPLLTIPITPPGPHARAA